MSSLTEPFRTIPAGMKTLSRRASLAVVVVLLQACVCGPASLDPDGKGQPDGSVQPVPGYDTVPRVDAGPLVDAGVVIPDDAGTPDSGAGPLDAGRVCVERVVLDAGPACRTCSWKSELNVLFGSGDIVASPFALVGGELITGNLRPPNLGPTRTPDLLMKRVAASSNGSNWVSFAPVPVQSSLRGPVEAMWAQNLNNIWVIASGQVGQWNGTSWREWSVGTDSLLAISGTSASDVWVGGRSAGLFRWNGSVWSPVTSPDSILAIEAVTPTDVWVVGRTSVRHWNGSAWTERMALGGVFGAASIWVASATDVFVGIDETGGDRGLHRITATAVSRQVLPEPIADVRGVAANDGWALASGAGGVAMLFHYDGVAWTRDLRPLPGMQATSEDLSIHIWPDATGGIWLGPTVTEVGNVFRSLEPAMVRGLSASGEWAATASGAFAWNGSAWLPKGGIPGGFSQIEAFGNSVHAAASNGSVWSLDAGSWIREALPGNATVRAFAPISGTEGWAVGTDGFILRWDGQAWTRYQSGTQASLSAVWALGPCFAMAVGANDTIVMWNGNEWLPSRTGLGRAIDDWFSVHGTRSDDMFVAGLAGVGKWNGQSWSAQAVPSFLQPPGGYLRGVWASGEQQWVINVNGPYGIFARAPTDGGADPWQFFATNPNLLQFRGVRSDSLWMASEKAVRHYTP